MYRSWPPEAVQQYVQDVGHHAFFGAQEVGIRLRHRHHESSARFHSLLRC